MLDHEIALRTNYLSRFDFEQWLQCPPDEFSVLGIEALYKQCLKQAHVSFNDPCSLVELNSTLYLVQREGKTLLYEYPRWYSHWLRSVREYLQEEPEPYTYRVLREAALKVAREENDMRATLYAIADRNRFEQYCEFCLNDVPLSHFDLEHFNFNEISHGDWSHMLDMFMFSVTGEHTPLVIGEWKDSLSLRDYHDGDILVEIPMPYWIRRFAETLAQRTRGDHQIVSAVPEIQSYAHVLTLLRRDFPAL